MGESGPGKETVVIANTSSNLSLTTDTDSFTSGYHPLYPAHIYNWGRDGQKLLSILKHRLVDRIDAVFISDCLKESMKLLTALTGWNEHEMRSFLDETHDKQAPPPSTQQIVEKFLSPKIKSEIRRWNWLDVELVRYVREEILWKKHRIDCNRFAGFHSN